VKQQEIDPLFRSRFSAFHCFCVLFSYTAVAKLFLVERKKGKYIKISFLAKNFKFVEPKCYKIWKFSYLG
jgi:hypothetical protein